MSTKRVGVLVKDGHAAWPPRLNGCDAELINAATSEELQAKTSSIDALVWVPGVAAAEVVAQPSICIDPPPQSSNSSLDAVVARALAKLAAPSLSWQSFMRGANLADKAVAVVRVRDAPMR